MKKQALRLALAMWLCGGLVLADNAATGKLPAGEISTPGWQGGIASPQIWVPAGEAPNRGWPVIIHIPAFDQQPNVETMLHFAGRDHYVIMSMPYLADGQHQDALGTWNLAKKEDTYWEFVETFLEFLSRSADINGRSLLLVGEGRGGLYVGERAKFDNRDVIGFCMLYSDRIHTNNSGQRWELFQKPAYYGYWSGGNTYYSGIFIDGIKGVRHKILVDAWEGKGPTIPDSSYLSAWFGIQCGAWENRTSAGVSRLREWAKEAYGATESLNGAKRYHAIVAMMGDPRFELCSESIQNHVQIAMEQLLKDSPEAADVHGAKVAMQRADDFTYSRPRLSDLREHRSLYQAVVDTYPKSPEATRARFRISILTDKIKKMGGN
jgi:hypothetical protein